MTNQIIKYYILMDYHLLFLAKSIENLGNNLLRGRP